MAFADDASWFLPAVFESFTPLFESRFEDRLIKQNKSRFFGDSCRGAPPFLDEGSAFENESLDGVYAQRLTCLGVPNWGGVANRNHVDPYADPMNRDHSVHRAGTQAP